MLKFYQASPPGILILSKEVYIQPDYLSGRFKIPKKTIANGISRYKYGKSENWQFLVINTDTWIKYHSVPANTKIHYKLPGDNEIMQFCTAQSIYTDNCEKRELTDFIKQQLSITIADYTRFIPFYRDAGLQRDRMEMMAKTHALFDLLSSLTKFTLPELFAFYNDVIDETFSFKTTNLKSFCRKMGDIKRHGIVDALMNKKLGNGNATKLTREHKLRIAHFRRQGTKLSFREVANKVNVSLIGSGLPPISPSSVKHFLKQDIMEKNLCAIYRNGAKWAKDYMLPFLVREAAKYPGDHFQIDGTRLQILYKDEKGELAFLYVVGVLDACSRKLVGYALGERECAELYVQALRMAFQKCNFLPAEILRDNYSIFKKENSELRDLIQQTTLLGVYWRAHIPGNPNDKSYIEAFFHVFHTVYCKAIEGYVGDGVKSKLEYSKPSPELIATYRKKNVKTKQELIYLFTKLVNQYNQEPFIENRISPSEVYAEREKRNVIAFNELTIPLIFYQRSFQKVYNSTIHVNIGHDTYYYQLITSEDVLKINLRTVQIRYSEDDPNYIYIYSEDSRFLTKIARVEKTALALVNQTDEDKKRIGELYQLRKRLIKDFDNRVAEKEQELSGATPYEVLNSLIDSKEKFNSTEDKYLLQNLGVEKAKKEPHMGNVLWREKLSETSKSILQFLMARKGSTKKLN